MSVRCLIVDDNAYFLHAASSLLEREGFTVAGVASTGAEALLRAGALHPDLVLVDVDLGGESGLDLARRVASGNGTGHPDVILISGHSGADFADLVESSPALAFLPKLALSAEAIRGILDRSAG